MKTVTDLNNILSSIDTWGGGGGRVGPAQNDKTKNSKLYDFRITGN